MSRPVTIAFALTIGSLLTVEQLKRIPIQDQPSVIRSAQANETRGIMMLPEDGRGHFVASALINGIQVQSIIDTGASVIAMSQEDASRIGIYPKPNEFTLTLQTAGGVVAAAPVKLRDVRLGGILVRDIDAVVLPPGKLKGTLLGMSFLRRLSSFQVAGGSLVLKE